MTEIDDKMAVLQTLSREIRREVVVMRALRERRFRLVEELASDGVPVAQIAAAIGVTRVTLHQQLRTRRERAHGTTG